MSENVVCEMAAKTQWQNGAHCLEANELTID